MENSFGNLKSSFSQDPFKPPSRSSNRFFIIVAFLIIIAISSFGGYKFLSSKEEIKNEVSPTPLPTEFFTSTETPTPTPTEKEPAPTNETKKPSPAPTKAPVKKTLGSSTTDKSSLTVEVLNGSGEVGAASKVSAILKELGYNVVSIGNADSFDYIDTVIGVSEERKSFLDILKKDVSQSYTVSSTGTASPSASSDAVVIVGKE